MCVCVISSSLILPSVHPFVFGRVCIFLYNLFNNSPSELLYSHMCARLKASSRRPAGSTAPQESRRRGARKLQRASPPSPFGTCVYVFLQSSYPYIFLFLPLLGLPLSPTPRASVKPFPPSLNPPPLPRRHSKGQSSRQPPNTPPAPNPHAPPASSPPFASPPSFSALPPSPLPPPLPRRHRNRKREHNSQASHQHQAHMHHPHPPGRRPPEQT